MKLTEIAEILLLEKKCCLFTQDSFPGFFYQTQTKGHCLAELYSSWDEKPFRGFLVLVNTAQDKT